MSTDERIATARIEDAARLVESAYRLYTLDPERTLAAIRVAIVSGVEEQLADIKERVDAV